ncbi:hypothetical protein ABZZ79_34680 [Streptomyces sp. NPDC006458]|uniref:hypothetical protein n=1 Tax=Streptomyces sp. NPDC006458 TaxID=3154302 RepID=UPI0033BC6D6E
MTLDESGEPFGAELADAVDERDVQPRGRVMEADRHGRPLGRPGQDVLQPCQGLVREEGLLLPRHGRVAHRDDRPGAPMHLVDGPRRTRLPQKVSPKASRRSWLPGQSITGWRELNSRRATSYSAGRPCSELHIDGDGRLPGLLVGFAAPPEHACRPALDALFETLRDLESGRLSKRVDHLRTRGDQ